MTRIHVDHRERGFLSHIGDLGEVRVLSLPVGDYAICTPDTAVIIERKSLNDFISSFRSGRLWEQLVSLQKMEVYDGAKVVRRILVIERSAGDADLLDAKEWSSVIGAQLECLYTYHIPIVQVEDKEGMATFLRVLTRREIQGLNDRLPPARWFMPRSPSELPVKNQRVLFLSMMPGIGPKLAASLLERFGSVERLCSASPGELMKVPGIGEKKARNIHRFLH